MPKGCWSNPGTAASRPNCWRYWNSTTLIPLNWMLQPHAVRVLQGLQQLEQPEVRKAIHAALSHPSPGVVRTVIEALPRDETSQQALLASGSFASSNSQVRLSALLALAEMPAHSASAQQAINSLKLNSSDRWLTDAGISAAATNGGDVLGLMCKQQQPFGEALMRATEITSEHVARSADGKAINHLVKKLPLAAPDISRRILAGLSKGWPKETTVDLDNKSDDALVELFDALPAGSKGQLIRLAQIWGSEKLAKNAGRIAASLLEIAGNEKTAAPARIDAAQQLITLMSNDLPSATKLLASISPQTPKTAALGMINAVRGSRAPGVGEVILKSMGRTPASRTRTSRYCFPDLKHYDTAQRRAGTRAVSKTLRNQQQALRPSNGQRSKTCRKVLSAVVACQIPIFESSDSTHESH